MADSISYQRVYAALARGESKDDFGPMDAELDSFWDEMAAEMADAPEGTIWDMPFEVPDVQPAQRVEKSTLVSKSVDDRRFTLGPMYIPNRLDAHNEWTDPDELQKAVWDYMRKGDRRIRLQHNREVVAGEAVEVMAWPYEVEVPMIQKDTTSVPMRFPENTVFLGVVWEPWAWELVKAQKIRGYSIGGRAQRLLVDLEGVEDVPVE